MTAIKNWMRSGLTNITEGSLYYNVTVKNGTKVIGSYDFWNVQLYRARCEAIEMFFKHSDLKQYTFSEIPLEYVIEINLKNKNGESEILEMELFSKPLSREDINYEFSNAPFDYIHNHWMNTLVFEYRHYIENNIPFWGSVEKLKDVYILEFANYQMGGDIFALPGSSKFYTHLGIQSDLTIYYFGHKGLTDTLNK